MAAVSKGVIAQVRVIIATGNLIDDVELGHKSSTATQRCLDTLLWAIQLYDDRNGEFVLVRTNEVPKAASNDSNLGGVSFPTGASEPERTSRTRMIFNRSPQVREHVIRRANGKCEYCGQMGFLDVNGQPFLETHHVIPLAEGGPDTVSNVVAICANDHRMAHYGADWENIRGVLTSKLNNDKR